MENEDIRIIKNKFNDVKNIEPIPEMGEHYYEVTRTKYKIKVYVHSGRAIIVPLN